MFLEEFITVSSSWVIMFKWLLNCGVDDESLSWSFTFEWVVFWYVDALISWVSLVVPSNEDSLGCFLLFLYRWPPRGWRHFLFVNLFLQGMLMYSLYDHGYDHFIEMKNHFCLCFFLESFGKTAMSCFIHCSLFCFHFII